MNSNAALRTMFSRIFAAGESIFKNSLVTFLVLLFSQHTIILEYFKIKEQALSNFAFQSFYVFIGTQDKNNFSLPVTDS